MKYRQLGRTGLQISEIGFGAWGIGKTSWIGADDQTSVRALMAARDAGVNFFDTALVYGNGHSERLLSRIFGKAPDIIIASKVPPKNMAWPVRPNTPLRDVFPKQYVLDCLRKSRANLQRERVDIYQFHVWSDEWANDAEWHRTVEEIRRSGEARFIGISINDHQPTNVIQALETGLVDTVQVIYNIFDQSPENELLPYCQRNGIGVIARTPLDEGGLSGRIHPEVTFPAGDFRNYYFAGKRRQEVWDRVQRLVTEIDIALEQLPDLALRFCLSNAEVSTVIPGMRTPSHVSSNVAASDHGPLPSATLAALRNHRWARNFYSPDSAAGSSSNPTANKSIVATVYARLRRFGTEFMPPSFVSFLRQVKQRL
jgi:aryl-alcohol dehydrogenase-like predicted oxidoreductase